MRGYVYGLTDPRDPHVVRYVGITERALAWRLAGHLRATDNGPPVSHWIVDLRVEGYQPLIIELEFVEGDESDLRGAERRWIASLRSPLLLNVRDGGNGSTKPKSAATIERMRKAHTGVVRSATTREKIGLSGKGRIPWNKGKKLPLEMLEKLRAARAAKRATREPSVAPPNPSSRVTCKWCREARPVTTEYWYVQSETGELYVGGRCKPCAQRWRDKRNDAKRIKGKNGNTPLIPCPYCVREIRGKGPLTNHIRARHAAVGAPPSAYESELSDSSPNHHN